jgi:conjugal transfer pilus assembly protein TraI
MFPLPQWVRNFLPGAPSAPAPEPIRQALPSAKGLRYPPADKGLPVLSPEQILAANNDLVERLRTHAAAPEQQFQHRFVAPLTRLAEHINVLPATAVGLFSGEMGLFRACLETAFYSFQASDGRIFTQKEGVERRHALEGRWRYLCFLAGLVYPLGLPLERVVVTSSTGKSWQRHFGGIGSWAAGQGADRIFVTWASADDSDTESIGPSNAGMLVLPTVAGPENLQFLEDGAANLVAALYQLATGADGEARIAQQVVKGTWERIAAREAARRPQAFGRVVAGTHLGPYLVGAIRFMVEAKRWKVNDSCLRADPDGLYLVWPEAAQGLIDHGRDHGYAGWPADAPTLAALLEAAKIVERRSSDLSLLEIVDEVGEIKKALKFASPLSILEDFNPADFGQRKTLQAIVSADPLVGAENAVERTAPAPAPTSVPADVQQARAPGRGVADDDEESADDPAGKEPAVPAPAPAAPKADAAGGRAAKPAPTRDSAKLVEAPAVSYADLVPEDVRADIGNSLQVELLGKVVKLWRARGENSATMRRTENGAAIALTMLHQIIRDIPGWADAMASAGLIYSPPSTPGLRVQKVAIPEGKGKVDAVVLSSRACKKLGL